MTRSAPDVADRHRVYLALALLAVALLNAANAAAHLMGPEMEKPLDLVQVIMAGLVALALAPMVAWKVRNRNSDLRRLYLSDEGYVARSIERAKNASWVSTFVLLSALAGVAERFDTVPAEFFIQFTIAAMLGVFSITFLFLNLGGESEPKDTLNA